MSLLNKYSDPAKLREELDQNDNAIRDIKPKHMATQLKQRVIGQDRVIDEISRSIAHRFKRPRKGKPIYTLFVSGPTGVGKTELAKATAEFIFGDEAHMFTVNVNSLQGHGLSSLIGSPKGYAGSNEWGALTKHLRQTPETLILFDELEKAGKDPNAEIYKMLLTMLDEGYVVEQSVQQKVSAEKSIIILTANAAHRELSEIIERHHRKPNVDQEMLEDEIKRALADWFAPEFLGRLDLITTLDPLSDESIAEICVLHTLNLAKRYKLELDYVDPKWLAGVVKKQKPRIEKEGMRAMTRMLERQLVDYFHDSEEEGASKVRLNFEEAPESKDGWRLSVEPTEWKDI